MRIAGGSSRGANDRPTRIVVLGGTCDSNLAKAHQDAERSQSARTAMSGLPSLAAGLGEWDASAGGFDNFGDEGSCWAMDQPPRSDDSPGR